MYWQTYAIRTLALGAEELGAAFFPRLLLGVLGLLSLLLVVGRPPARVPGATATAAAWWERHRLVVSTFALFAAYAWSLSALGYLVSTSVFLFALQLLIRPRPARQWAVPAAVTLGATFASQRLFEDVLRVLLPRWPF